MVGAPSLYLSPGGGEIGVVESSSAGREAGARFETYPYGCLVGGGEVL